MKQRRRPTSWEAARFAGVVALLVIVAACSRTEKAVGEIRAAFAREDYQEAMVLCERAIRRDVRAADVYYYYGMSLLRSDRDYEAFRRFAEAVEVDSTFAGPIADDLTSNGKASAARGDLRGAAARLRAAADLQSSIRLGRYGFLVADLYYQERDFESAVKFYETVLREHPDTTAAEAAYFNLAQCHLSLGDTAAAADALEEQLDTFPRGPLSGRAEWKLENLLFTGAETAFAAGDYEKVIESMSELLARTSNVTLIQRARFLLGEAYEREGKYRGAYEQYKAIIREDRGASGRVVERAREKIAVFRDSGLL